MSIGRRQAGYTIIELTLFLGISALLFTIAIFATGNTIRSARFSDSTRSLEAFVQKQYDNILNGVNPRANDLICNSGVVTPGSQDPGTSNCLLIGKLLMFHVGSHNIEAYDIVATDPGPNVDFSKTDEQLIAQDYQPQPVTNANVLTYEIPWQARVSGIRRISTSDPSPLATNVLALIRSPRSQRILAYSYKDVAAVPTPGLLTTVVNSPTINASKVVNYCVAAADGFGAPAKLVVTGTGSNQSAAQVSFSVTASDCNGT